MHSRARSVYRLIVGLCDLDLLCAKFEGYMTASKKLIADDAGLRLFPFYTLP